MVLAKGLRPLQVVSIILFVRILSVFLVQTWYVPDEYWQTLEVAHKFAFGYGALTWEWHQGIRSYIYPSIVTALYALLKVTGLDYPEAVVYLPRILQALLSTAADYNFYQWTGGRKWALFLVLTSWFWFYTSGRTLLQTFETTLVAIALSLFPFKDGNFRRYNLENSNWMGVAMVCLFVRPTSAPLWVVLAVYQLITCRRRTLMLTGCVPIILSVGSVLVGLDSFCHGSLVVTPWEFFRFNVLHDIASFYGKHPWHWYLTVGLPAVLGVNLPLVVAGAWAARRVRERPTAAVLLVAAGLHLALHSFIPHKEFRFLLPLLPLLLYVAQEAIVPWSRKAKNWQLYLVAGTIFVGNVVPALYFGAVHQAGALQVMPLLRKALPHNRSSVTFLMPCHSTPLYSHLHKNVTARYLHCEPPLNQTFGTYEAETFFNNPQRWWRTELATRQPPTLLVLFDKLRGRVDSLLAGYTLLHELPHTQFPEGEVGEKVLVYKRSDSRPKTPADEIV